VWTNAPASHLRDEVAPHAEFAVHQALLSPALAVVHTAVERLGEDTWRIAVGVTNTGWLPTDVSVQARRKNLVLPVSVSIDGAEPVDGPARIRLGQLEGRVAFALAGGSRNDGTPDRALATWVVRSPVGTEVRVEATHPRAGTARTVVRLD
jgi:hypothetical protein